MTTFHRLYTALRRIAGPCASYRIARALAGGGQAMSGAPIQIDGPHYPRTSRRRAVLAWVAVAAAAIAASALLPTTLTV